MPKTRTLKPKQINDIKPPLNFIIHTCAMTHIKTSNLQADIVQSASGLSVGRVDERDFERRVLKLLENVVYPSGGDVGLIHPDNCHRKYPLDQLNGTLIHTVSHSTLRHLDEETNEQHCQCNGLVDLWWCGRKFSSGQLIHQYFDI